MPEKSIEDLVTIFYDNKADAVMDMPTLVLYLITKWFFDAKPKPMKPMTMNMKNSFELNHCFELFFLTEKICIAVTKK